MPLLFSTAYFPPVSYMAACMDADELVLESCETYTKQTCRNHCVIYGANGRQILSVPVHKVHGNHTLVRDVQISYAVNWQQAHRKAIESAYRNSPFFLFYQDELMSFFEKKIQHLFDLNLQILEILLKTLGIEKKISFTTAYEREPVGILDQRELLISKHHRQKMDPYTQVFSDKSGFLPDLSILDLVFNLGPDSMQYLKNQR
jgi:WbqC-like protein family